MMSETGLRRILPHQSTGSVHSFGTQRHPSISDPILSKRVCFYKSGDPQFNGLRMVINNRTFKTFDALLDSLSKKVPLPFGVRNITTPRGVHAIHTLDELEDGKSYICSESRKVKPINLALARKKLPPWYHASPVSSRRRTVQQARFFPGQSIHKKNLVVLRTPKRLLVFRNGDPMVKHTVVLHKRTTPTFESILEYISELLQFHVVKLHTSDGRRVDSLTGLILCSGIVVASGREKFRPANYNAQKSPVPTMLPSNRMGRRRLKAFKRKKKYVSYTSKSRKFSPSSERYIVSRIHDSNAESPCYLPSNPTNSAELESGRILESVAETDGARGPDSFLPSDDDIEKSFRVNQDGSMTVEMKVRLTIKEEETIHWTTTLTRSSVANQLNAGLPEPEAGQEISSLDLQSPVASIDTINKDQTEDNTDEEPPSLSNGAFCESSNEDDNIKAQMDVVSPWRAPTPGHKRLRQKQTSLESIQSVMKEGFQEGMFGSYSYKEHTEHGAMTEQYCMVKQRSTKPVPKPRRFGSVDAISMNRNVSTFKSAGMTEILQIESNGEEVSESVLHIYEQQTCQDNFLANLSTQSAPRFPFCRPATSGTGQLSSSNDFEPELWRPSTASESVSIWRAESMSATSDDLTFSSMNTSAIQATDAQQQFPKPTKGKDKPQQREVNKDKRTSSKHKVVDKHVRRILSPGKRQKENYAEATDKRKKVKTFSSAGFIKKIYGGKSKSAKSMIKLKKGPTQNGDRGVTTKSLDDTVKCIPKDQNIPSASKENTSEVASFEKIKLNVTPNEESQPRGILTRQTSVHQEKKNKSCDVSETMSLPAFNSSSSVTNEYVENWLEKTNLNPIVCPDEQSKKFETLNSKTQNDTCRESENRNGLDDTSEIQTCQTLKADILPETVQGASVRQRIQSFENKSSPSMKRAAVNQQNAQSHTAIKNKENCNSFTQHNTEEIKPHCSEINPLTNKSSVEIPSDSPIKISLQEATPSSSSTLSMELLLPPPPAENTELSNTEDCVMDESSAASSPLYSLSSVSSKMSDNHPLSISPTSDKPISSTDHTMEMTTSIQTDIPSTLGEAPLPRTSSIKRAPLVSNLSLDRKMSLRKACVDKYTLCSDATSETTTSSTPINIVGDNVLPNGLCSTGTQRLNDTSTEETQQSNSILDLKNSPPCYVSRSPTSSSSEERVSSASISCETRTTSDLSFKEMKTKKPPKEASSPKPLVKKVKIMSSPSPERKPQTKKFSPELSHSSPKLSSLHNHPPDKTVSPKTQKHPTPNASPSTERKLYKPTVQKKPSPYSQSLDMASPPNKKLLSRDPSSDNASSPTIKTQRKASSERRSHQRPPSESTSEPDKTNNLMTLEAGQSDDSNKTADQEKSITETQLMPLNITNQPNLRPVLEEICYSIKSIRQITQNKRRSCLEKSNSMPDFSSHVASTFGSSSKALLAFLSVMTLKEGISNLNMDELNANSVSCAEALKMIDSLREIASIEDSHKLKVSLSNLQQSASKQLLQSWKGFQELGEKCKSQSTTPNDSEHELATEASPDCGIAENVIDEFIDNLDIPEELKEELASLSGSVKSDSDDNEKMSADIMEPKDNSTAKISNFPTEDVGNVRDVTQDETTNVDVSSIIKRFTDITQPKQSRMGSLKEKKPTDQATKDKDSKYGQNGAAKCPPAESNEHIHEERQLYSIGRGEKTQQQGHDEDISNQEKGNMIGVVSRKSIAENGHAHEDESGSEKEGQNMSSANKDLEHNKSCEQSVSSLGEPQVECEGIQQESDDLSNHESHSEGEEDKQPSSSYYAELSIRASDSQNKSSSEEEEPEVEGMELSNKDVSSTSASPSHSEKEEPASSIGLNVTADESHSDVDEPSSEEEEQSEVQCKGLKAIMEEGLSGNEEESLEEEEHLDDLPDQTEKALVEETEEDKISSDDDDHYADETQMSVKGDLSNLIENQDLYTKKDDSSLIKSDSLEKRSKFNSDEDSGNDHSSCEEHVEVERPKIKDSHICSSIEEELSYYEKESSSDEEHTDVDRYIEESCTKYQEVPALSEVEKCEKAVGKLKHQSPEVISQSIAERVILLEKQVADSQKKKTTTESSPARRFSQRNAPLESDTDDLPSDLPTPESGLSSLSAPPSSLSFSYDSSGIITKEPEGNRVRAIREMFLAKSATDVQHGHKRFPSPNTSEFRTQTSASGGYQSQTSSELSSSEDDSARKSITKGFVRRTIERLYGKKDVDPHEEVSERPPSAPKQKKKEHSSIFSPFHTAKAMSEFSYFNSSNALDTFSETTRCMAFNAQVGPGDSAPIDNGLRENTQIRKSVSDPVGINKTFTNSPQGEGMCEDTEVTTKSELEDNKKSFSRKCTYFSFPHASDSDVCLDDQSTVSKGSTNGDTIIDTKDNSEDTKTRAERNGALSSVSITDFKMMDNKVHPLIELPPDGEVVVAQPGRGQGVMNRRIQEPDMLDLMYNFCGQNCPIL